MSVLKRSWPAVSLQSQHSSTLDVPPDHTQTRMGLALHGGGGSCGCWLVSSWGMLLAHHTASLTRLPLIVRYFTRKSTPAWMHKHHNQFSQCCVSTAQVHELIDPACCINPPMVDVVTSSNLSAVNRINKQLLPTAESPTRRTCRGVSAEQHVSLH